MTSFTPAPEELAVSTNDTEASGARAAWNQVLLEAITTFAKSAPATSNQVGAFRTLLATLTTLTRSEGGLIAHVCQANKGELCLSVMAVSGNDYLDWTKLSLVHPAPIRVELRKLPELFEEVIRSGRTVTGSTIAMCPDAAGDPLVIQLIGIPLLVDGQPQGVVAFSNRRAPYPTRLNDELQSVCATMAQTLLSIRLLETQLRLERELRIREERWNYALTGSGAGVFDWDIENSTVYLSQQWKAMLGYEEDALDDAVATWSARVHPDDAVASRNVLDEYLSGRATTYENEYRLQHRDGSWRWILARGKVVAWNADGQPSRFVGTQKDITERKLAHSRLVEARDAAVLSARVKSDFLAVMTHELRTPLNAVIGMATLLEDTPLDDIQRDYVSTLKKGGATLLATVNDILELSKLESGRVEVDHSAYDIRQVVLDVLHLLKPTTREKGLPLRYSGPTGPVWVQGDAHRVRQILLNLVGNATKFTHAGYIHVHLTVLERGGPQVRLLVEDTGIGIPLSKQSTIFEAFKQVDSSITRRYGGTGLGLTICKRLVELMRGEIDVRTRPGGGTVFEVTIPTSRSSPPEAPTVSRRSHELMVDTQLRDWHPYVLVADDDAVNQKVVRAFLVRLGARVDCVNDGSEAVQAVSRGCYDVVLMDCQMPIVDGMEATRRIRALDVEAHSVPIVALTANALDEVRERCACAGMNEFLSKPIQRNALREVLYRLMASREPIVHS